MNIPKIKPGDIFLTTHPGSGLSKLIIAASKRISADGEARFSHAAHVDINGLLLDTVSTVKNNPVTEYAGRPCVVYRPLVDSRWLWEGLVRIRVGLGERYPWARLALHLFRVADNIHWDRLVCSERVCKFLHFAFRRSGNFDFENYFGKSPDWIDDYCRRSVYFEHVFEGIL